MRSTAASFCVWLVVLLFALPSALADVVAGTLASVRIDRKKKELVLTGTVSCTQSEPATVNSTVTQGSHVESATTSVTCGTSPAPWELRLPLGSPPFHPGKAIADIGFLAGNGATGRSEAVKILPK